MKELVIVRGFDAQLKKEFIDSLLNKHKYNAIIHDGPPRGKFYLLFEKQYNCIIVRPNQQYRKALQPYIDIAKSFGYTVCIKDVFRDKNRPKDWIDSRHLI